MPDLHRYIVTETAINAVANAAMGTAAFAALFHGQERILLWGAGGVVTDCVLQGFMVGLMSVMPPSVLTRIRIAKGRMAGELEPIARLVRRAMLYAVASMVGLTLVAALLARMSGAADIAFAPGLAVKALASVVLVCIVTPPALRAMLAGSGPWGRRFS